MSKRQTPYGHPANIERSRQESITSPVDYDQVPMQDGIVQPMFTNPNNTTTIKCYKINNYHRGAVEEALANNGAISGKIVGKYGNYFNLAAEFPDVDSAELAISAIRKIKSGK